MGLWIAHPVAIESNPATGTEKYAARWSASSTSQTSARLLNTLSTTSFSRTPSWHLSQENTESFDEIDRVFYWRAGKE